MRGAAMGSHGILYTVEGPKGSYYAIHDPATGRVRTERTEQAARAQAQKMGITLVADEIISHEELLRRTGREMGGTSPSEAQAIDSPTESSPLIVPSSPYGNSDPPTVDNAPDAPALDAFSTGQIICSAPLPDVVDGNDFNSNAV
ncbi:MAG TPA: hypothetical protein VK797_25025 [Tepidisphaeraceae bacterium]|jgi:hypothetical protein|nr:hypothetical protein [Tepidisphaeraceae bacterium]